MRPPQRAAVVAAVAVILFCAGYCLAVLVNLPLPRYFPVEHRWGLEPEPGAISQGWYGGVVFALLCGVAPAALLDLVLTQMTRPLPARLPLLLGLAAAGVALVALVLLMARELGGVL